MLPEGGPERRKSIKRDEVYAVFERLIKSLVPPASLFPIAKAIVKDIWQGQVAQTEDRRKAQKTALKRVQDSLSKAADRLMETDSAAVIRALEAKLEKLEAEQLTIAEHLAQSRPKPLDFEATFRTALDFLSNPWKYWDKDNQHDRQAVLKLVFAAPTPYTRNRGFRTAKTTLPFKALGSGLIASR